MGTDINGQKRNKDSKHCQIFSTHKGRQIVSNNIEETQPYPLHMSRILRKTCKPGQTAELRPLWV